MKITFDSNTWEKVITEDNQDFLTIKDKIRAGEIHAYICEIALTLEAIEKILRSDHFEDYLPLFEVNHLPAKNGEFSMQICIGPNPELHPGLHPKQLTKLLEARELGFRVLRMTNIGTVRTQEIPDDMYVEYDDLDEFWNYAEPLESCSNYITRIGCGQAAHNWFKEEYNLYSPGGPSIPSELRKKFAEAIAEWADGDSLSAHYAAGNDFFCTDDNARNAGTKSIFHSNNRNLLEAKFNINIISSCEAARL